jgi:2-amino-4-hydroxy-6-hydroxymethyldihydropteridine diphosphokinase
MMAAPVCAWIGLGGNLGDCAQRLETALDALAALPQTRLLRRSRLYRSPPWGIVEQPPFVNAVAEIETALTADALLAALLDIERGAGRTRDPARRWGPRELDLDLLLYGDRRIESPGLNVPHPRIGERAFVLVPMAELAPETLVPGQGRVADLLRAIDASGVDAIM